jgi:hypothetical protein
VIRVYDAAGNVIQVADCVADCIRLVVPQPTAWQNIGNQIKTAFVFSRA